MITGNITIESNRLGELASVFPDLAAAIVRKTTFDLESGIKDRIVEVDAIDTGNMLNTTQGHHERGSLEGEVVTAADYWGYVDGGTHNTPARPLVGPPADVIRPTFEAALVKAIEGA